MQKSKFLILFILLFSIFGCGNKQKDSIDKQKKKTYNLIGKRITSIDSIVPDKNPRVISYLIIMIVGAVLTQDFLLRIR
mgnify:CR=1 FL=1